MFQLMTQAKGPQTMKQSSKEVLIFTPTPNEFAAVKRQVDQNTFKNFRAEVIESGPGKINAAFKLAETVLPRLAKGERPAFVVGTGTSGSLSLELAEGDVVASASAVISDWLMEDDSQRLHSPYGLFQYAPLDAALADEIELKCPDGAVTALIDALGRSGFKKGRLLTSDTFVAGRNRKISSGEKFKCVACDMESGAFSYVADRLLGGLPCFHLRIVADTLDETLADYMDKEQSMVEVLGAKTVEALKTLDQILEKS